ncbi:MAG TPA: PhzF family phenazine biosynthesis protein, partial [Bradyrhizobium sp.]|nr:PhzF family phenazine biosynthesis protein [Bradyrhizobium sp.]
MERRYITVDVFTDRAFGGNPLAVVLDAGGLSTAQMQAIATEFNYSETTFVLATLAAKPPARLVFEEKAGLVPVEILTGQGGVIGAELTAPQPLKRM